MPKTGIVHAQDYGFKKLERKIAFSTLIQYAGKVIQLVLALLITRLLGKYMAAEGYGDYRLVSEYVLFFAALGNLGIFANLTRRFADNSADSAAFFNGLLVRGITGLTILVPGFLLGLWVLGSNSRGGNLHVYLIGAALFVFALLCDYLTTVCTAYLQATYRMGRATLANVIYGVVHVGLILLFLYIFPHSDNAKTILAFGAISIGSLTTMIVSFIFTLPHIKLEFRFDRKLAWSLLLTGLPFGIISIINTSYFRFLPQYFVRTALGKDEFGAYSMAMQYAQYFSLASTYFMFSVLPGLREYIDNNHWLKVKKVYTRARMIMVLFAIMAATVGSIVLPMMIAIIVDESYIFSHLNWMYPMLMVTVAVSYLYDMVLVSLFAFGKEKWFLKRELAALTIGLVFFFCSLLLPAGSGRFFVVLLGTLAAEGFIVSVGLFKVKQILGGKNHIENSVTIG